MTSPLEIERPTPDGRTVAALEPSPPGRETDRQASTPFFSVIIPVRDGADGFDRCLLALEASSFSDFELIVVDDASSDRSPEMAAEHGARVVRLEQRLGSAAARNRGAAGARGEFLFFLDADCDIHPDALSVAAEVLRGDPELDAVFGSYDDRPLAPGLVSRFKNLFHHWMHQQGQMDASTFWAGCGAVRRDRFRALDGFDERRYREPSIEDIEFGYRLKESGGRIRLAPRIQVRHAKRWTLTDMVRTDLLRRGAPWTELLLEKRGRSGELNTGGRHRLVVAVGLLVVAALAASPWVPQALGAAALLLVGLLILERGFYLLLIRRGGPLRALGSVPLHLLYCVVCAGALILGCARVVARRLRAGRSA